MDRQVTVGGAPRSVPPVNGFKTKRIAKLMGRAGQHFTDIRRMVQEGDQEAAWIPHALRVVPDEVEALVGILLADNAALLEADLDPDGDVDGLLRRSQVEVMHAIESPRELTQVCIALVRVLREDVPKGEELEQLVTEVSTLLGAEETETEPSETSDTTPTTSLTPSTGSPPPTEEPSTPSSSSTDEADETSTVSSPA